VNKAAIAPEDGFTVEVVVFVLASKKRLNVSITS
jgi:hypothetical protein